MSISQIDIRDSLLVAPISYFTSKHLALVGGKGANLGELSQAGFDVPPGFVVTTTAYDLLLQENNLHTRLAGLLQSLNLNNPDSIEKVSQQIRDVLQQASIPERIINEIAKAYRDLNNRAVAVRSSATAEDLPEAAFAGQQETFLNIIDEHALMDSVRACWMSLWSERAILYRARQNVDQSTVKLAVVIQEMVPADVAGVMFTANPVSGARDELIIDANPGLGEAVVSGMVTPDHFVVNKRSRHVKEQRLGRREVVVRSKPGGGTEQVTSIQESTNPTLLPQSIRKLSRLGMEIEHHYGTPQDIEWAWVQNETKSGKLK